MKKNKLVHIIFLVLVFGCEQVVELDIEQSIPQIVIEGLLTNKDTVHYVKVSKSIQFYETGLNPITNAIIHVSGAGEVIEYSHNPTNIDSLTGYYFSDLPYAGKIGEAYKLHVDIDGVDYEAEDTMLYITKIDSLSFQLAANPSEEDFDDGKIYELLLYAAEPQESNDYYQFYFYRDNEVITYTNNIYVFSDEAFGPSLNGLSSPVLFREGELASVQMLSLTREQYIYYIDLSNLLNSDGGMFSPPPANPRNTFSNKALGLWQVSAVSKAALLIAP